MALTALYPELTVPLQPTTMGQEFEVSLQVSAELFDSHRDKTFWVGIVASKGIIELPEYYDGHAKLRGNVYVRQLGFLPEDQLDAGGREIDEDDNRSVNFAVIENCIDSARVVGSGRLIVKDSAEDLLPIEEHFPEVFEDKAAEVGSVEVSRFIARHENDLSQHKISLAVIRALTLYAVNSGAVNSYCIIESPLERLLRGIGIPVEQIGNGDAKNIPQLGGELLPVQIDPYRIVDSLKERSRGTVILRKFFENERLNGGEGYYPVSLTGGQRGE